MAFQDVKQADNDTDKDKNVRFLVQNKNGYVLSINNEGKVWAPKHSQAWEEMTIEDGKNGVFFIVSKEFGYVLACNDKGKIVTTKNRVANGWEGWRMETIRMVDDLNQYQVFLVSNAFGYVLAIDDNGNVKTTKNRYPLGWEGFTLMRKNTKGGSNYNLVVFKATYGLKDVTQVVQGLIKDNTLQFDASNSVFGDSWHGVVQSCVIVYSYDMGSSKASERGVFTSHVACVKENESVSITPSSEWPQTPVPIRNNDRLLYVYGAVYGVLITGAWCCAHTGLVQSLVDNNSLEFMASNECFGDPWVKNKKALTLVYSYGSPADGNNNVRLAIVQEGSKVLIAPPK